MPPTTYTVTVDKTQFTNVPTGTIKPGDKISFVLGTGRTDSAVTSDSGLFSGTSHTVPVTRTVSSSASGSYTISANKQSNPHKLNQMNGTINVGGGGNGGEDER